MNNIKFITFSLAIFAVINVTAADNITYQTTEFYDNIREVTMFVEFVVYEELEEYVVLVPKSKMILLCVY